MSDYYIFVIESYSIDSWGQRRGRSKVDARCVAKVEGKDVAQHVCDAMNGEYRGGRYALPQFGTRSAEEATVSETAAWEVRIRKLNDIIGAPDDHDERSRDAAYHRQAAKLEAEVRKRLGLPDRKASAANGDGNRCPPEEAETKTDGKAESPEGQGSGQLLAGVTGGKAKVLPACALKAGEQYRQAVKVLGTDTATDREVYEQIEKAFQQAGEADDLPSFDTWRRNLRMYRKATGTQKHRSRTRRSDGARSVVDHSQL